MTDMITRFTRSLEIVQASINVLRSDSRLLVLPLLSGAATAIVAGAFIWGATASGAFAGMESGAGAQALPLWSYAWLFVFYFVQYFIIIFFNTALVGAGIAVLAGEEATVGAALTLAASRIVPIAGYALISATFGILLRMIAEKLGFLGRLIELGAGLAWTVATFLVVPVLAAEGVGPIKAIERSSALLRETWGENIIGSSGISVVTSLIGAVVAVAGIGGGMMLVRRGALPAGIALVSVSAAALIALALVGSALSGIYAGAVYYFALTGRPPRGFDGDLVRGAFAPKDA